MLEDLGHPAAAGAPAYDVTYENVQAGLRADYLFRLANQAGGLVVGTSDLSELALGWATYGVGDQMSHYAVNAGAPKTLIQHLIRWSMAKGVFGEAVNAVLGEVLAAEISPELVPGAAPQSTQAVIGPYALQDFTLFHFSRYGMNPAKIAFLALAAWGDAGAGAWPEAVPEGERRAYSLAEIKHWLGVFLRRFFVNQFKRSALPNGPKLVSGGALSPRGDWRMPSDASAAAWLADLERVPEA
jgi:NAD+ synthase (glutamine-hydrolysing)